MEQPPFEAEAQAHKRARVQRWSQETEPNLEMRDKTAEEGEPSRASNKSSGNQGNLLHAQPCSVSNQVAKVKQSVADALTSIRRCRAELETMEQKLEDSLQEINNLGMICTLICSYINLVLITKPMKTKPRVFDDGLYL